MIWLHGLERLMELWFRQQLLLGQVAKFTNRRHLGHQLPKVPCDACVINGRYGHQVQARAFEVLTTDGIVIIFGTSTEQLQGYDKELRTKFGRQIGDNLLWIGTPVEGNKYV